MLVPGDWNTQKEKLFYYEGSLWYKTSFDYTPANLTNRTFLYFGAANYQADVYLNGQKLGKHIGGFTPFNFEITQILRPRDNFLILKVDNKRVKDGVPTLNTDWWNYGGLTRDVKLIETTATFIADYFLYLDAANPEQIKGYVQLNGPELENHPVRLQIPELSVDTTFFTNKMGRTEITFTSENIAYWSVEDPKRYQVSFSSGRINLPIRSVFVPLVPGKMIYC